MDGLLLVADIGNTNVTLGAYSGRRMAHTWRIVTDKSRPARWYARELTRPFRGPLRGRKVGAVAYGSVVPVLSPRFAAACRSSFGLSPIEIGPRSPLGLRLRVKSVDEVGADRLLNCLAAYRLFGGPVVILDFGTATTVDCVTPRGVCLAGAILPGPNLAAKALGLYAAKLPVVPVARTPRVITSDTVGCIQAGVYHGYVGMVDRVLSMTLREMGAKRSWSGGRRVKVVATGGLAGLVVRDLPRVDRCAKDLTLQGLRLAYEICGSVSRSKGRRRH